jgi:hypothetical protein
MSTCSPVINLLVHRKQLVQARERLASEVLYGSWAEPPVTAHIKAQQRDRDRSPLHANQTGSHFVVRTFPSRIQFEA